MNFISVQQLRFITLSSASNFELRLSKFLKFTGYDQSEILSYNL